MLRKLCFAQLGRRYEGECVSVILSGFSRHCVILRLIWCINLGQTKYDVTDVLDAKHTARHFYIIFKVNFPPKCCTLIKPHSGIPLVTRAVPFALTSTSEQRAFTSQVSIGSSCLFTCLSVCAAATREKHSRCIQVLI